MERGLAIDLRGSISQVPYHVHTAYTAAQTSQAEHVKYDCVTMSLQLPACLCLCQSHAQRMCTVNSTLHHQPGATCSSRRFGVQITSTAWCSPTEWHSPHFSTAARVQLPPNGLPQHHAPSRRLAQGCPSAVPHAVPSPVVAV